MLCVCVWLNENIFEYVKEMCALSLIFLQRFFSFFSLLILSNFYLNYYLELLIEICHDFFWVIILMSWYKILIIGFEFAEFPIFLYWFHSRGTWLRAFIFLIFFRFYKVMKRERLNSLWNSFKNFSFLNWKASILY